MHSTISPSRKVPIARALLLNIALVTVFVGGIAIWLVTHMGERETLRHEAVRLNDIAQDIGQKVALTLSERHGDIRTIRDLFEHELARAPLGDWRAVMERTRASREHYSWLGVVAADGPIRIGTSGLLEGVSVAGRNWFEGAMRASAFFGNVHPAKLLEPHIKNPDGAPLYLLDIALPLRAADGKPTGVVGSHLNWKIIEEVVRHSLGAASDSALLAATVTNADGAILYDTRGAVGGIAPLLAPQPAGRPGNGVWPGTDEVSLYAAAAIPSAGAFDGLGWRIVVREPAATVQAGVARMKWQVLGASVAVGLLFSLLGLLAVRSVTRPLQALVKDIAQFGKTETLPGTVANDRISEVRDLHSAFLEMATNVWRHREQLRETQIEIVKTLGRAGEFRDNETGNHVLRMSLCCARLAELSGLDRDAAELIHLASQMHDVGKIGIPDHILLKPGRFEADERAVMEQHSSIGARILTGVDTPLTVLARTIALTHHEKWDGGGYPSGLAGEAIPLAGRITAICDVFDALLSSRPYKQGWPLDRVEAFLREQAGRHFDPTLVSLFLEHLDEFVAIRDKFRDEAEESATAG